MPACICMCMEVFVLCVQMYAIVVYLLCRIVCVHVYMCVGFILYMCMYICMWGLCIVCAHAYMWGVFIVCACVLIYVWEYIVCAYVQVCGDWYCMCIYVDVCRVCIVYMHACVMCACGLCMCMWKSKDNFWQSVLFFHYVFSEILRSSVIVAANFIHWAISPPYSSHS